MLNINLLRKNLDIVIKSLYSRGYKFDFKTFIKIEKKRKAIQIYIEKQRKFRKNISKKIRSMKVNKEDTSNFIKEANKINEKIKLLNTIFNKIDQSFYNFILKIPNLPHNTVPIGNGKNDNIEIYNYGKPRNFNFQIKDHVDLGKKIGLDFESSIKISGSRFTVLKGPIARLHRALGQFMLDVHTKEHGYIETYIPYIVNSNSLIGTGQLPKFSKDMFKIEKDKYSKTLTSKYLIPTAEISLINTIRESIINENILPIKLVAHSPCFRSEAGSYGKDTRGIIRQHQFDKVEIVQIVSQEKSYDALEEITRHAEIILEKLELPYRKIILCTKDISFSAAKTYDLEVWLPAQKNYIEISSCSNTEDFQSRRMQSRYRNKNGKLYFTHTLNGSGLAVGRTLAAILENFQNSDGSISIPKVLLPYIDNSFFI